MRSLAGSMNSSDSTPPGGRAAAEQPALRPRSTGRSAGAAKVRGRRPATPPRRAATGTRLEVILWCVGAWPRYAWRRSAASPETLRTWLKPSAGQLLDRNPPLAWSMPGCLGRRRRGERQAMPTDLPTRPAGVLGTAGLRGSCCPWWRYCCWAAGKDFVRQKILAWARAKSLKLRPKHTKSHDFGYGTRAEVSRLRLRVSLPPDRSKHERSVDAGSTGCRRRLSVAARHAGNLRTAITALESAPGVLGRAARRLVAARSLGRSGTAAAFAVADACTAFGCRSSPSPSTRSAGWGSGCGPRCAHADCCAWPEPSNRPGRKPGMPSSKPASMCARRRRF